MNSIALSPKKVNFDYQAHFGVESLINQAQQTHFVFQGFVKKTFQGLLAIGNQLWDFYEECCRQLDTEQGKQAFDSWLASDEFGGSRYLADTAMTLSPWYNNLPKGLQKLVATRVEKWSLAALKELPKLTNDLVEKLVNQGKQTAKSLKCAWAGEQPKHHLLMGELVRESDWLLVAQKYELADEILESLKLEAQQYARVNPDTGCLEVQTEALVQALETFGYEPSEILPKPKVRKYSEEEVKQIRSSVREQAVSDYKASLEPTFEQIRTEAITNYQALKEGELAIAEQERNQAIEEAQIARTEISSWQKRVRELEQALAEVSQDSQRDRTYGEDTQGNRSFVAHEEDSFEENTTKYKVEVEQLRQELAQKTEDIETLHRQLSGYARLQLPLTNDQMFVGASIQVISDTNGWLGETGTVVAQGDYGHWWVMLDRVNAQGLTTENKFKAGQLAFNLDSLTKADINSPENPWKLENQQLQQRIHQLEEKLAAYNQNNWSEFQSGGGKRRKPQGFGQAVKSPLKIS